MPFKKRATSPGAHGDWQARRDEALRSGLPAADVAKLLRGWAIEGTQYSRSKKRRFIAVSTTVRLAALGLLAASTIILGLQDLEFWPSVGFVTLTLATFVTGLETFFNWRSRWVLAEEAQYRFYRLQDELEFLIFLNKPEDITPDDLKGLFDKYQGTWDTFSLGWLEERRRAGDGTAL